MPETVITEKPIPMSTVRELAAARFGDLVKAVVDIERKVLAIGGELHADQEQLLIEHGSKQQNLWGINLYPNEQDEKFIEFDSMINLRPGQGNRSRGVEDPAMQQQIRALVAALIRP